MSRSWWRAYLAVNLGLAACYLIVLDSKEPRAWLYMTQAAGALVALLVGLRANRPAAVEVWWLLAASQACIVASGMVGYLVPVVTGAAPAYAAATVCLVAGYAGHVTALGLLIRRRGEGGEGVELLDAVIMAAGAGVLSWVFLIAPNLQTEPPSPIRDPVVVHLVLGLLLLAAVARLGIGARTRTPALLLLFGWAAARLAADSGFALGVLNGEFHSGHPAYLGWLAAYGFLGAAALHPSMRTLASRQPGRGSDHWGRVAALAAAALLAPSVLIVYGIEERHGSIVLVALASGLLVGLILVRLGRLIGVLARAEAQLTRSGARLVEAQRIARVGSLEVDLASSSVTGSTEMYRMFDVDPGGDLSVDLLVQMVLPDDRHIVHAVLANVARDPAPYEVQVRITRTDGDVRTVLCRGEGVCDAAGRVVQLAGTLQDITERKRLEHELTRQALHDPLTGLANRALLQDRVQHALIRATRTGERLTLLFIDLDDFKLVNDSLGHEAGDRLLVAVAERLQTAGRAADTIARLGGDEFAILLEGIDDQDAIRIAERVLAALRPPVELDGTTVRVHASIGIAHDNGDDDAGALLRNADLAMYAAKRSGKGRFQAFAPAMQAAVIERVELDAALRQAVDAQHFRLHYQPIVVLASREVVGFEALLRWSHPQRGSLPPDRFVPMLEESGLIVPVGNWILREACGQAAAWQARTGRALSVSVNVSPRQLQQSDFVDQVAQALAGTGLPASSLILEITEGVMVADTDQAVTRLHAIADLGVRTAVDDFGTGYSSLRYLQTFPVEFVKIAQSFIAEIQDTSEQAALAQAIVKVGRTLRLAVIAEGIETARQADYLQAIGCEYGQGHHFARPQDQATVQASLDQSAHLREPITF